MATTGCVRLARLRHDDAGCRTVGGGVRRGVRAGPRAGLDWGGARAARGRAARGGGGLGRVGYLGGAAVGAGPSQARRGLTKRCAFDPASALEDVDVAIGNYMSVKAVQLVMLQLRELNPEKYTSFYEFVHENSSTMSVSVGKSKLNDAFLERLVDFDRDLAERVMKTRVYLFKEWCTMFNDYRKLEAAANMEKRNLGMLQKNLMASFSLETIEHPLDASKPQVQENVE